MQRIRYYYLIKLQYLGFRYHGWQKQPKVKTVERMVERTTAYVLGKERKFKLLASGRTDAMVSVNQTYIELFVDDEPLELDTFFKDFNRNLPQDIRALEISETTKDFNVILDAKTKEYLYLFSFGEKTHPFCAPFMVNIPEGLDIKKMQEAAVLFEGEHDFWSYAFRPKPQTQTRGEIYYARIEENTLYKANFFPEKSYLLRVKGKGFKRHQLRLMMGVLFALGKGEVSIAYIRKTLNPENRITLTYIAPASGLILNNVQLKQTC